MRWSGSSRERMEPTRLVRSDAARLVRERWVDRRNDGDNPASTESDGDLLVELNAFVQDVHFEKRPADFKPTTASELAAWYRSLLQAPTARAWIAEQDGLPVGYVLAIANRRGESPFGPPRQWWRFDQIAVDPRFRRRGVGRALILKAIAEVKTLGIPNIEVQSWAFNQETHAMLRDVGFVPKTIRFELTKSPR